MTYAFLSHLAGESGITLQQRPLGTCTLIARDATIDFPAGMNVRTKAVFMIMSPIPRSQPAGVSRHAPVRRLTDAKGIADNHTFSTPWGWGSAA
ncbi:MAG: hypothetical protein ACRERE_29835 [Candidatus Entotheonellia bacterium]